MREQLLAADAYEYEPVAPHVARRGPGPAAGHVAVDRTGCPVNVIGWIIFGLIVGVVAKMLMPGRDPGGFVVTIGIGIVGALLGGFLGRMLGLYREGDPVGFFMAVIGSIALLWIYRRVAAPTVT
jgi:uncharacterized membrane protein YeaQ/YmgE (transglycosylase-associated protein family)